MDNFVVVVTNPSNAFTLAKVHTFTIDNPCTVILKLNFVLSNLTNRFQGIMARFKGVISVTSTREISANNTGNPNVIKSSGVDLTGHICNS